MGGREARAVLVFVLVSLLAGSAYRAWIAPERPTLVDQVRAAAEASRLDAERRGDAGPTEAARAGSPPHEDGDGPRGRGEARGDSPRRPLAPAFGALDPDRASAADWERLPGIGPALAARIVADRAARGPFGGPEGLARVKGIGPRTVERLRPYFRATPGDSGSPIAN
ncbi:MAG TPA: helix-hairpin-helix domain-containing protein [Acidobacteriota bacterium]|nr:helix-hairpin-helix domain-containing protein [Acidobacteriota bacterium]